MIPPAKTGRANSSNTVVIKTDQVNNDIRDHVIELARMLEMVAIKLTAPKILLAPAKWSLKIAMSTLLTGWNSIELKGG